MTEVSVVTELDTGKATLNHLALKIDSDWF